MLDRPSTRLASTSNQIGTVLLTVAAGGGELLWEWSRGPPLRPPGDELGSTPARSRGACRQQLLGAAGAQLVGCELQGFEMGNFGTGE